MSKWNYRFLSELVLEPALQGGWFRELCALKHYHDQSVIMITQTFSTTRVYKRPGHRHKHSGCPATTGSGLFHQRHSLEGWLSLVWEISWSKGQSKWVQVPFLKCRWAVPAGKEDSAFSLAHSLSDDESQLIYDQPSPAHLNLTGTPNKTSLTFLRWT